MNCPRLKSLKSIASLCVIAQFGIVCAANAGDKSATDSKDSTATAEPAKASAGLLPIPDYTGSFWENSYLTGDWGGERTALANKGVQFGIGYTQFLQSVDSGGKDQQTQYGGNVDYTINLDLMRMGVLPGALIKFRAQSRYGGSVNGDTGAVLPVNTNAYFPLTKKINQNVGITITDLNYTQFLSPHLGVTVGKLDTLDGDPNEFASGRGTSQFMNASLIFNPTLALRLPYSTLGAGVIWMPIPTANDRGITVSSIFMNTQDSSTTSGFDDFGKGTTWNTEADFRYKLGNLPGGMNVGALYSFNQHFAQLNSKLIFQPGQGVSLSSSNSTWAAYWSMWQYFLVKEEIDGKPLPYLAGSASRRGLGFFARAGVSDQDTNPFQWAASGGIGGRGMIPSRDNDTFGVGYYYTDVQKLRISGIAGLRDSMQGVECFYNLAVTPACRLTFDVQVVQPIQSSVQTATILGLRASLDF